jgi:hypothetical protein
MSNDNPPTEAQNQATDDGDRKPAGKMYSKSDVTALIEKRLIKERRQNSAQVDDARAEAVQEWRDDMGLDDSTLDKIAKSDETTMQIRDLNKAIKAKDKTISELESKLNVVEPKLRDTLTRDAVFRAAAGKAVDPVDVWNRIKPELQINDDWTLSVVVDGESSDTSLDDHVSALLDTHKHLALPKSQPGAGSMGNPHTSKPAAGANGKSTADPVKDLAAALAEAASTE